MRLSPTRELAMRGKVGSSRFTATSTQEYFWLQSTCQHNLLGIKTSRQEAMSQWHISQRLYQETSPGLRNMRTENIPGPGWPGGDVIIYDYPSSGMLLAFATFLDHRRSMDLDWCSMSVRDWRGCSVFSIHSTFHFQLWFSIIICRIVRYNNWSTRHYPVLDDNPLNTFTINSIGPQRLPILRLQSSRCHTFNFDGKIFSFLLCIHFLLW